MVGKGIWKAALFILGFALLGLGRAGAQGMPMERTNPFALDLDVSQGLLINSDPITPYRFTAKLTPELHIGDVGFGLSAATRYTNPNWDFGVGLRGDWLFAKFATNTGIRLVVDGTPWLNHTNNTLETGLVADLSGLARIGTWYGYDTQDHSSSAMISAGFDIISMITVMNPHNPEPNFHPKDSSQTAQAVAEAAPAGGSGKKVALVISGGGSTGAWALGAIQYMTQDKGLNFNMVCGTSTGSLISPLMVTGELDELLHIYTTVTTKDIFLMNSPSDIIAKNSAFSTSPLQKLIGTMITPERWDKIHSSSMEMILTASNLQKSQPAYFYTGPKDLETGEDDPASTNRIGNSDTLMRAMLASASDPVICPTTHVPQGESDQFSDGGVENFVPISIALLNGADVVYAVVLSPEVPDPAQGQFTDPISTLQQTINMFANRVGQADVMEAQALARQLGKKLILIRPKKNITDNAQIFDPTQMKQWIKDGYARAKEVLH